MFAAPQMTPALTAVTLGHPATGGAQALARAYLDYVSGCWRGDAEMPGMGAHLATFFGADMPEEPARAADAYSPHGAGGQGIRWYDCGNTVYGFVAGSAGGYRVPLAWVGELCSGSATAMESHTAARLDRPPASQPDARVTGRSPAAGSAAQARLPHVSAGRVA